MWAFCTFHAHSMTAHCDNFYVMWCSFCVRVASCMSVLITCGLLKVNSRRHLVSSLTVRSCPCLPVSHHVDHKSFAKAVFSLFFSSSTTVADGVPIHSTFQEGKGERPSPAAGQLSAPTAEPSVSHRLSELEFPARLRLWQLAHKVAWLKLNLARRHATGYPVQQGSARAASDNKISRKQTHPATLPRRAVLGKVFEPTVEICRGGQSTRAMGRGRLRPNSTSAQFDFGVELAQVEHPPGHVLAPEPPRTSLILSTN